MSEPTGTTGVRRMITLDAGAARFGFRAVGVPVEAGHVLLHQVEGQGFWSLPGGRVELLEPAGAALTREMREEMGVGVEVGRLPWVVENLFDAGDHAYHELSFLFQIALPAEAGLGPAVGAFTGQEEFYEERWPRLIFRWFPIADLEALPLYPIFPRTALRSLPATPARIVSDERAAPREGADGA